MLYTVQVTDIEFMAELNPFLQTQPKSGKDVFTDFMQTVVLGLAFSLIMYLVFLVPSIVDGQSMEPNFYNGELLFANKTIQWFGATSLGEQWNYDYKRGDVVIFDKGEDKLIKRVIATEGDTVRFNNGELFVNGKLIEEEYIPETTPSYPPSDNRAFLNEGETVRVPSDSYFLMGDNREFSKDSRFAEIGFVSRDQLEGKVFIRYWPIPRFQMIKAGVFEEVNGG